ncbi:hypothetical protein HY090_00145 [Candidatus Kaiserbacteria bacterium]|nr:hypothetical protein [Candidatus Kaiserbacteria bacterium]
MAINLREQGLSYREILEKVPVAKSTLSVWLSSVGLSKKQKQRLTEKKRRGMERGWATRRRQRVERTERIHKKAVQDAHRFINDPLFILGTALYWAEGSKQKEWNVSQLVSFSNMDPMAHEVMLVWIEKYFKKPRQTLWYEIYIHESADIERAKKYWSSKLRIQSTKIRVYLKRHNPLTKRHNRTNTYYGVLKFTVPESTDMNRHIAAWTQYMIQFAV